MAIINLTPDSFWKESRADVDNILFRAEKAIKEGAALIDVGAQSTRPNYTEVSADEEMSRLEKPLLKLRRNFDIPISVDTYFSRAADFACELGADMVNDIWGLSRDGDMAATAAKRGVSLCLMHNSETPLTGDVFPPVIDFLKKSTAKAVKFGVSPDKICIDGGIGFAKDREQNLALLKDYDRLSCVGYPLLLGTSRKSLFGGKAEDRLAPTVESTRLAARKGVLFVRVHDVKENVQAIKEEYGA